MCYVDDKGKVLDIQTPLTEALNAVIEGYFDMLSKMTAEQRLNYFKYEQFVEPLRYTQDIDNTTYVVRTHFNQNADKTILKKIEKIVEKDSIQYFKVLNLAVGYVIIKLSHKYISDCGKEQNK